MAAVFSSKNARADGVWPVSHHQPASDAAYNREGHMGQQVAFVKGGRLQPAIGCPQSLGVTVTVR
jgi:hypothetical protein